MNKSTFTPKIQSSYTDFTFVSENSCYVVYKALSKADNKEYTITALNINSEFVKNKPDTAATLLIQELIHFSSVHPNSVLLDTFEMANGQIAWASLPFTSLKFELHNTKLDTHFEVNIPKMLADVASELEFLSQKMKITNSSAIIGLENIYQYKSDGFHLGNWAEAVQNNKETENQSKSKAEPQNKPDLSNEINALGFAALEACGVSSSVIEQIKALRESDQNSYVKSTEHLVSEKLNHYPESVRIMISRMLSSDPKLRPTIKEIQSLKKAEHDEERKETGATVGRVSLQSLIDTPKFLAWCSAGSNLVSIHEIETDNEYANFEGARLPHNKDQNWSYSLAKEIPETDLLLSLNHSYYSDSFEVFDISQKQDIKKVFAFDEVVGDISTRDVSYNTTRNLLACTPLTGKTAYHLFEINPSNAKSGKSRVSLIRKSIWQSQFEAESKIEGIDINPEGKVAALIDTRGICMLTDIDSDSYLFHIKLPLYQKTQEPDYTARCKWSSGMIEPTLFLKYDMSKINLLDVEKKTLTLKEPVQLEKDNLWATWIDVCPADCNLLAVCGECANIKVYDRRVSKVVKTLEDGRPAGWIYSVRWDMTGELMCSASDDKTAKVIDFGSGKVVYSRHTKDGRK